jgi:hypothetical protein
MTAGRHRYRVHRIDVSMTRDQAKLEQFLDGLEGEVIAIVPNVSVWFLMIHRVDFLLVVEKIRS